MSAVTRASWPVSERVATMSSTSPDNKAGITDDEVLQTAFREDRILLTEDKDFGELVCRLKKPAYGMILIRIDVRERHKKEGKGTEIKDCRKNRHSWPR